MKLEPHRVLALFDVLFRRAPLVVEGHHAFGWAGQVDDDEAGQEEGRAAVGELKQWLPTGLILRQTQDEAVMWQGEALMMSMFKHEGLGRDTRGPGGCGCWRKTLDADCRTRPTLYGFSPRARRWLTSPMTSSNSLKSSMT